MSWIIKKMLKDKTGATSITRIVMVSVLGVLFLAGSLWLGFKVAKATSTTSQILQTSNDGATDSPNAGGFNAGAKTYTGVNGSGAAASLTLQLTSGDSNLSTGKTCTASSTNSGNSVNGPIDGNYSSGSGGSYIWVPSVQTAGEWWQIDLGAIYMLNYMQCYLGYYDNQINYWQNQAFNIYTSIDGSNWILRTSMTLSSTSNPIISFGVLARYVKYVVVAPCNSGYNYIRELQIVGKPFAYFYPAGVYESPTLNLGGASALMGNLSWSEDFLDTGLRCYLKLDEGSGLIATDSSSYSNNAAIPSGNIAQGKTVDESSQYSSTDWGGFTTYYPAAQGVDGNTSTAAITLAGANEWWKIDLGADYILAQIDLVKNAATQPSAYKIQTASDWAFTNPVDIITKSNEASGSISFGTTDSGSPLQGRYFRVYSTSSAQNVGIVEFRAFVGGVSWVSSGHLGKCLSFDGISGFVPVSNALGMLSSNITADCWIKANDTSSQQWFLNQARDNPASGWGLWLNNNMLGFSVNTNNTADTHEAIAWTTFTDTTNWHHVTATYNGTVANLYLDGTLAASATASTAGPIVYNNSEVLTLGRLAYGSSFYFNGLMDEVKLYNRLLGDAEIAGTQVNNQLRLLLAAKTADSGWARTDYVDKDGDSSVPLGLWHFNEGAGWNINYDATGAGNSPNYTVIMSQGKTVAANSIDSRYPITNLVDGNTNTYAQTNGAGSNLWFKVDLGAVYNIYRIYFMKTYYYYPQTFVIQVASDWAFTSPTTIYTGNTTNYNIDLYAGTHFSPVSTRYMRIMNTDSNFLSLYEFQVYVIMPYATTATGKFGLGLGFNGTSNALPFGDNAFDFVGDMTAAAWIKTSDSSALRTIAGKLNASAPAQGWALYTTTNGKARFDGATADGNTYSSGASTTTVTDNNWHFIVGQRSGSNYNIFVDGVKEATATGDTGSFSNAVNMYLGSDTGTTNYFNGSIDEFSVDNRAWPQSVITKLYNNGVNNLEGPLSYDNNVVVNSAVQSKQYLRFKAFLSGLYAAATPSLGSFQINIGSEPPSNITLAAASQTSMSVSWTDNCGDEDNFPISRSLDGSAWSTLGTPGSAVTSVGSTGTYTDTGLTANTKYYYRLASHTTQGYQSSWVAATIPAAYRYTLVEPVTGSSFGTVTTSSIICNITTPTPTSGYTNWGVGQTAVQFTVTGDATGTGWTTNTSWTKTGLTPNTPYNFYITTRNADGVVSATYSSPVKYTYATPAASWNVTANPVASTSTWNNTYWTFTNNLGFGTSGVGYYRYAWDNNATYTSWLDTETQWTTGTLSLIGSSQGNYYLHLKGYSGDTPTVACGTKDYGPFQFDGSAPTPGPTTLYGIGTSPNGGLSSYLNAASNPPGDAQIVNVKGIFDDSSRIVWTNTPQLKVQFSENKTDWGVYNGTVNYTTGGANWSDSHSWTTINPSSTSQTISNAWRFATPDGQKTLYVRLSDAAGNVGQSLEAGDIGLWKYKTPILVTGTTVTLTDYPVAVDPGIYNNSGLLYSFHFSEGSGTTTYCTQTSGGATITGATWTTAGRFGKALNFTGSGSNVYLYPTTSASQITIEAWVNLTANVDYNQFVQRSWGSAGGFNLFSNAAGNVYFGVMSGTTQYSATYNASAMSTNAWHYLVGTYDGSTVRVYVDGVPGIPATIANVPLLSSGIVYFGNTMNGLLDEVKIYSRALSAEEISARYNGGTPLIRHDYQDLRFTNTAGVDLPFWMSKDNQFNVRVDSIPTTGTTIYEYYGSPNISTNASNIAVNTTLGYAVPPPTASALVPVGDTGGSVSGTAFNYRNHITVNGVSSWANAQANYPVAIDPGIYNNTGLVGSWHLNESSGSTMVADMSGNLNLGTFGYNNNVAQGKTVTSNSSANYPFSQAVDGSLSTYGATYSGNYWMMVDLGASYNISQIDLCKYSSQYPSSYNLQVSNSSNFSTYTTITTQTADTNTNSYFFVSPAVNARYVRVITTASQYIWFYEFRVWTVYANTPTFAAGKFGNCLSFNGTSNYVNLGDAPSLNINGINPYTIEAWIRPDAAGVAASGPWIFSRYNASVAGAYGLRLSTGKVQAYREVSPYNITGNTTLLANNWYHVVTTYDGTYAHVYVNGVEDRAPVALGTIANAGINCMIGAGWSSNAPAGFFSGLIDEVKVYNRALSAGEIAIRYGSGTPPIRHDYQDIRFTNASGTELPFWQESDSRFWVKVDSIPKTNTGTTLYEYFGNASATSTGNIGNTFIFGDDFSGDLSKWGWNSFAPSNYTLSGGVFKYWSDGTTGRALSSGYNIAPDSLVTIEEAYRTEAVNNAHFYTDSADGNSRICIHPYYSGTTGPRFQYRISGGNYTNGTQFWTTTATNGYVYRLTREGPSTFRAYLYSNATQLASDTITSTTWSTVTFNNFSFYDAVVTNSYLDWFRVRPYISPEPVASFAWIPTTTNALLTHGTIYLDTQGPTIAENTLITPVSGIWWNGNLTSNNITWSINTIVDPNLTDYNWTLPIALYYSTNGGSSWATIPNAGNLPNNGSFTWTALPSLNIPSNNYEIKIGARDAPLNYSERVFWTFGVDMTAPDAFSNTFTKGANTQYQYITGTKLYYNSNYIGGFTISCVPSDTLSGIQKVNFPALLTTGGGDDTSSPYSMNYTWTVGAISNQAWTTTAYNNANMTRTSAAFSVINDILPSSGGSISYDNSSPATFSVPISLNPGIDAGSGLVITTGSNASALLQRAEADYSDDHGQALVFGSFGTVWTATDPSASITWTDTSFSGGKAYKYQYVVTDNVSNSVTWTSANVVRMGIKITSPAGGETWTFGQSKQITWTGLDSTRIPSVNILLSRNHGDSWDYNLGNYENTGTLNYTVGDFGVTKSQDCRIRVEDADVNHPTVFDTSDADFSIKGSMGINSPAAGVEWTMGTRQTIGWDSSVDIFEVDLSYSRDNGTSYFYTVTDLPTINNDGSYAWTVPLDPCATVRLKVADADDATSYAESNTFIIKGVRLTSPNGAEIWTVGEAHNLTWTYSGTIPNVNLEYSTNSGTSWTTIINNTQNNATYPWTVAGDSIGATTIIRVSDTLAPTIIRDASDSNFTSKGIRVNSPNGSENWTVGEVHAITWSTQGAIGFIKLQCSTDGGSNWWTIANASSVNSTLGTFNWTVSGNATGAQTRIRAKATSVDWSIIEDISNNNFTVNGVKVVSPNGSEVWTVGTTYAINWSTQGTITPIRLEYSADAGTTWTVCLGADGLINSGPSGSFNWTVPLSAVNIQDNNNIGGKNNNSERIRITSVNWSAVTDSADNNFAVNPTGTLSVTQPSAQNITWNTGSPQQIKWTSTGTINNVRLEYSTDWSTAPNATTWSVCIGGDGLTNTGLFSWTIPNEPAVGTAKVRVSDPNSLNSGSTSLYPFTIPGTKLISPNGGESWTVGTTHDITWTFAGTIARAYIFCSTDGGSNWWTVASLTTNPTIYSWTIPNSGYAGADTIGVQNKIRVSDRNLGQSNPVYDDSNAVFTITAPLMSNVTVNPPTGETGIYVGDVANITWTSDGSPRGTLEVSYSTNGTTWTVCEAGGALASTATSFSWTAPANSVSNNTTIIKVKDTDAGRAVTTAQSSTFSVNAQPAITIIAPAAAAQLRVGRGYSISWTGSAGVNDGHIQVRANTANMGWTVLTSTGARNGSLTWTLPQDTLAAADSTTAGQIEITDSTRNTSAVLGDVTTTTNLTVASPVITVTSPASGDYWGSATTPTITWSTDGAVANVNVYYDHDHGAGTSWSLISSNVATTSNGATNLSWTVPDDIGASSIRVVDTSRSGVVFGVSNAFNIVGSVSLTQPPNAVVNDTINITWSAYGTFSNVRLQMSSNGTDWRDMNYGAVGSYTERASTASPYVWTVPNAASATSYVRIYDPNFPTQVVSTSVAFNIGTEPFLTFTAPVTPPSWRIGTGSHIISWTSSPNANRVRVAYSTNNGTTWTTIASDLPKDGSFSWTIPQEALIAGSSSSNAQFSITDTLRSATATTNSAAATILPPQIFAGNIPNVLTVGVPQAVTWTLNGQIGNNNTGNVRIIYSTDGTTFKHPITGVVYNASNSNTYAIAPASGASYTWTVRDETTFGSTCVVRLIDDTRPSIVYDISNNFRILHGLTSVTTPVVSQSWYVEDTNRTINWTYIGDIGNIKLEYSTNGTTWTQISGAESLSPANAGGTAWAIGTPAVPGTGSYVWPGIPDTISDTSRIRLTTVSDTVNTTGTSAIFYIKGSFTTPTMPQETLNIGSSYPISWTTIGTVDSVNIYYAPDGNSWTLIRSALNNPVGVNSWTWTIGAATTSSAGVVARVKIENAADHLVYKESSLIRVKGSFSAPAVPPGTLEIGTDYPITWTSTGRVPSVNIYYAYDGNQASPSWTLIGSAVTATSGSNTWTWSPAYDLVPSAGESASIKIEDAHDNTASSVSAVNFRLKGSFTAPNPPVANASWTVNSTHDIRWTVRGVITRVNLKYYTPATDWTLISGASNITVAPNALNSFTWTVPDDLTALAKVRVEDAADATVYADSSEFNIVGTVGLTSPAGNEEWIIGTHHDITWTTTAGKATMPNVKIEYSYVEGNTNSPNWGHIVWTTVEEQENTSNDGIVANDGSFNWTIPDHYTTGGRVRVSEASATPLSNVSILSGAFIIASPKIQVTSPNSTNINDNALDQGKAYNITWSTTGTNTKNVKIEYTNDSADETAWTTIDDSATNGAATKTFMGWVPQLFGGSCQVRITELSVAGTNSPYYYHPGAVSYGSTTSDYASDIFTIYSTPIITISAPTTGTSFIIGQQGNINWAKAAGSYVKTNSLMVYYTQDGSSINTNNAPVVDIASWTAITSTPISNLQALAWVPAGNDFNDTLVNNVNARIKIVNTLYTTTDYPAGMPAYSNLFTFAVPAITLTQPNGEEYWAVGDVVPIAWTSQGSLKGPLTLIYTKTGNINWANVASYPTINNNVPITTSSYNWTITASHVGETLKLGIYDNGRSSSGGTHDDSNATFRIISAASGTMTAPTSASHWYVGKAGAIGWTIHGVIGKNGLNIQYSDDNFVDNIWAVATAVSRGTTQINGVENSGNYVGSYTWTIPSDAHTSNTIRVRMLDPDRNIYWTSAAFPLTGGFTFKDETIPANDFVLDTRWISGTRHNITWFNIGSHTTVQLQYAISTDGTTWGSWTNISASHTNNPTIDTNGDSINDTSIYPWTVPDPAASTYPASADPNSGTANYYVKLRLIDGADNTVTEESARFRIGYYKIGFAITNEYNKIISSGLNFRDVVWNIANATATVGETVTSFDHYYPAGTYTTLLVGAAGSDFGNDQISNWVADGDKIISKKIYSNTFLQTEWDVRSNFFFDEDNDNLKVNTWLERKGSLISGDPALGEGGSAYIRIYSSADPATVIWTLSDNSADSNGGYWFSWTATGLSSGVTYFARCGIYYNGDMHESGATFAVSVSKKLKEMTTLIQQATDAINTTTAAIATQTQTIQAKIEQSVEKVIQPQVAQIMTGTSQILTAVETTIPAKITTAIQSEVKPYLQSGIVSRDTSVKTGGIITVSYRTTTGLAPTIDVYDPKNVLKVSKGAMKENGTTGVYDYSLKFPSSWGMGDFTVVCSEATKGTVDAQVISVYSTDIQEVSGQVSAVLGSTSGISGIKNVATTLSAQFNLVDEALTKLSQSLTGKADQAKGVMSEVETVYKQLEEMSVQIDKLSGASGVNLKKLYEVSREKRDDMIYLKNKTQELKASMELSQKMIENVARKPVVQTWFEFK